MLFTYYLRLPIAILVHQVVELSLVIHLSFSYFSQQTDHTLLRAMPTHRHTRRPLLRVRAPPGVAFLPPSSSASLERVMPAGMLAAAA